MLPVTPDHHPHVLTTTDRMPMLPATIRPLRICRTLFLAFLLFSSTLVHAEEPDSTSQKTPATETIQLNGTEYPIPPPWAGNRIHAPPLAMDAFAQIPVTHTRNGTRLYIVKEAQAALVRLLEAAQKEGILLQVESGYRSSGYQHKIFTRMLEEGRRFDDIIRYVAPPGYSEHALGTAVDFFPSNWEFARLPAYDWLRRQAVNFGFTETYPQHNRQKYPWEAWHWTYREKPQTTATAPVSNAPPQG